MGPDSAFGLQDDEKKAPWTPTCTINKSERLGFGRGLIISKNCGRAGLLVK